MTEKKRDISRYQNGKIYTIRSYQTDDYYIGSTCKRLSQRMHGHRTDYKSHQKGKCNYVTSYEIIQYDDHYIELLEMCPCGTKAELEKREGELIRLHACVNKVIPGRTKKQYYEDNKESMDIYKKKHYEDNKEYYTIKKYQYRQDNKESISNWKKQLVICECGKSSIKGHIARHRKTKKCRFAQSLREYILS